MDSITHVVLGAVIGEACFGKKLGKKAMLIGAGAQSIPDIDFVDGIWLRPVDDLLAHRGITHSIFFIVLTAVLIGWLAFALDKKKKISFSSWILLFGLEMSVHLLLDCFNCYGTGLLEPFSSERFSLNALFVADPFFSVWPGVACVVLLILKKDSPARVKWSWIPLLIVTAYLFYALINKSIIEKQTKAELEKNHLSYSRLLTTPAPLNNWLWFVAAETDSGYYVNYRSVFDGADSVGFVYFLKEDHLSRQLGGTERIDYEKLIRFSQGFYTLEKWDDALMFNDLRFGQMAGWVDPHARFSFHYDLRHPDANLFVVQQGRFANWNWNTVVVMMKRIAGVKPANSLASAREKK